MSATTSKQPEQAPAPRRQFLSWLWIGLGSVALLEGLWVVASFFRPRRTPAAGPGSEGLMVAGRVERFAPGSVTAFPQDKFYLVRLQDGGFLALHRRCTHLGCTAVWDPDRARFNCPCHASAFDITGAVLSSPAPRPLDRFAVHIENGVVKVDTRAPIPRRSFEPGQVERA